MRAASGEVVNLLVDTQPSANSVPAFMVPAIRELFRGSTVTHVPPMCQRSSVASECAALLVEQPKFVN